MKPTKKIRATDALIRKRAEERTLRERDARREADERRVEEAEERRAQKRAEKRAKPPVRNAPRDYEPPDKPYSKLNARRAILRKMIEIEGAQSHVRKLFDSCYGAYLNWQLRGQTAADRHELEHRMKDWARGCHIEDEWFVFFACEALSRYWRESNERRLKNAAYRAVTKKEIESDGAFEYQRQAWRHAATTLYVERPSGWDLRPPSPPDGLPMINTGGMGGMPTVAMRKGYIALVKYDLYHRSFAPGSFEGPAKLLSEVTRRRWVKEAVDELTPIIDSFWFEYSTYLYSQGWVPIESKRLLNLHSEWLVLFIVLNIPLKKIADTLDREKGISGQGISDAIHKLADIAGVTRKKGRKIQVRAGGFRRP